MKILLKTEPHLIKKWITVRTLYIKTYEYSQSRSQKEVESLFELNLLENKKHGNINDLRIWSKKWSKKQPQYIRKKIIRKKEKK